MKRAGGGVCNSTAIGLQKRIEKYLKNIAPGIL